MTLQFHSGDEWRGVGEGRGLGRDKTEIDFMRFIFIVLIEVALMTGCGTHAAPSAVSTWTPPRHPSPEAILNEAEDDARAGRYAIALAKQVWFYQNALKYDPAQSGVRVSFALLDWAQLGEAYPPALEQLKVFRDEAAEHVRHGKDVVSDFGDFVAINEHLDDDHNTSQFFAWLDANKPEMARAVFEPSEQLLLPALVKNKEYILCGKYVDADASFKKILQFYRHMMEHVNQHDDGGDMKTFERQDFINKTTTLIAILIINHRETDAQGIVDKIAKESGLPEFKAEIQRSLNGEPPASHRPPLFK